MKELIRSRSEVKQYAVYAHYYEDQLFYIGSGVVFRNSRGLSGRSFDFSHRNMDWFFFCNGEIDKVTVEILFVTDDQKESLDVEEEITRMYIEKGYKLTNKNFGAYPSSETRNKMSEAHKGIKHSKETRELMSLVLKGENNPMWGKRGKETPMYGKRGKDCHNYGKKHTKEAKQRMSESRKGKMSGKNNPMYGKTAGNAKKVLVTNNLTSESKVFDSVKDAHKFISQNGFDKTQSTLQYHLNKGSYNFKNYTMEVAKDMVSE